MSETFDLIISQTKKSYVHDQQKSLCYLIAHREIYFSTLMADISLVTEAGASGASTFMREPLFKDSGDVRCTLFPIGEQTGLITLILLSTMASICLIRFSIVRVPVEAN